MTGRQILQIAAALWTAICVVVLLQIALHLGATSEPEQTEEKEETEE